MKAAKVMLVLGFERDHPGNEPGKARAIRDLFDLSAARYYAMLNRAIDDELALLYDPVLVAHLRRLREQRRLKRSCVAAR